LKKVITLASVKNTGRISAGIFNTLFKVCNRAKEGILPFSEEKYKSIPIKVWAVIG